MCFCYLSTVGHGSWSATVVRVCEGTELYFEYGFLGDADVLRLTKTTAKALKLKASTIQVEEGHKRTGYVISLDGLNFSEYNSIPKLKSFFMMEAIHLKTYMDKREQLTTEQGQNWFSHLCTLQMNSRPTGVQDSSRHTLKSVTSMRDDPASEWPVESPQDSAPQPLQEPSAESAVEAAEDAEDVMLQALQDAPAVEHRAGRAVANEAETDFGPGAKQKPKAQKRKRDAAEDEDEDLLAEFGEGSVSPDDHEMIEVARRHGQLTGKQVTCFGQLVVARHLAGEKLGKAIQGVARQKCVGVGV